MRPFITALLVFPLLLVTARPSTGQDLKPIEAISSRRREDAVRS